MNKNQTTNVIMKKYIKERLMCKLILIPPDFKEKYNFNLDIFE